jgi:drug/metabolite transporter (DMT)-like permease
MNPYVIALLLVTLVWGATFPVIKVVTSQLSGIEVSALRFLAAAVILAPSAMQARWNTWRDGAVLGAVALVSYVAQAYGLEFISSNRSAFLTSLNVLMVPLLGIALGARPSLVTLIAACMACGGIALMSWEGGSHLLADAATVLSALAYAIYVIVLSQRTQRHKPQELAATQVIWMALIGGLWLTLDAWHTSPVWGGGTLPSRLSPTIVAGIIFLGIVATAGMLFLQALAQKHVAADKAALIYAMEPVFAAAFAWAWLAEVLSPQAAVGAALVVSAIVMSEWKQARHPA